MKKYKFVDLNSSLVEKIRALGIEAECADYFLTAYRTERPVLMTASNPQWSFGGGIDAGFVNDFPQLCAYKRMKGGGMERIANICFCVTVDNRLQATKEQVEKAIKLALENTYEGETLLIHGAGTGIGGLSEDDFVDIISCLSN